MEVGKFWSQFNQMKSRAVLLKPVNLSFILCCTAEIWFLQCIYICIIIS